MVSEERYQQIKSICDEKGYTLLTPREEIMNNQSYVTYICPKHGEYITKVGSIIERKSCYKCSREMAGLKKWRRTEKERHDLLYNRVVEKCEENGYELLTPFESDFMYKSYIQYRCPKHGIKQIRVGNLLSGKKCSDCNLENARKRYQLSKEEVFEQARLVGSNILNPEEYVNNTTKNLIAICPRCGKEFITSLKNLTQHGGQSCPDCTRKESIGERKVRQYLEEKSIRFKQEKWFSDCRDINPLPFDFYLPDQNCCIEFDGKQHYCDNHYFRHGVSKTKDHDGIKTKYCEMNNIKLIRIPYWNINKIDILLNNELA